MKVNKIILMSALISLLITNIGFSYSFTEDEIKAQYLYIDAVSEKGSIKKIELAKKEYEKLISSNKNKIEYKFRLASLQAVRAKYIFWPNEKLELVNKSIRQFDRLEQKVLKIQKINTTYEFHLYRGRTYINFPKFLGKYNLALSDFKKAAKIANKIKRPKKELGPFYLNYANELYRNEDYKSAVKYSKLALKNELTKKEIKKANKIIKRSSK